LVTKWHRSCLRIGNAMTHASAVSPGWKNLPTPRSDRLVGRHQAPVRAKSGKGTSRYELLLKIGAGGMASVYIGRVSGSGGFSRLVAVKRAHPHLLHDDDAQKMLVTEARLASRLNHANVVSVQDVEHTDDELLLVMDYVEGASLAELLEAGSQKRHELPGRIAVRVALDACAGLAAVHELEGDDGRPVGFLHRDVSPQNILVGVDGTTRIADFGLARGLSAELTRATGTLKGKLAYLAPEIIDHGAFSVQSDLFAMGVVLWEALAKQRLFRGDSEADTVRKVGLTAAPKLSKVVPELGDHLDGVVARALEKDPMRRYGTVREFASAVEALAIKHDLVATSAEVSGYVRSAVGEGLKKRREIVRGLDGKTAGASDAPMATATQTVSIGLPGRVIPIHTATITAAVAPAAAKAKAKAATETETETEAPRFTRYLAVPDEVVRLRRSLGILDETTADAMPGDRGTQESITDIYEGSISALRAVLPSNQSTVLAAAGSDDLADQDQMVTEPMFRPPPMPIGPVPEVVELGEDGDGAAAGAGEGKKEEAKAEEAKAEEAKAEAAGGIGLLVSSPTARWDPARRPRMTGMAVIVAMLLIAVGSLVVCLVVPAKEDEGSATAAASETANAATATPTANVTANAIPTASAIPTATATAIPTATANATATATAIPTANATAGTGTTIAIENMEETVTVSPSRGGRRVKGRRDVTEPRMVRAIDPPVETKSDRPKPPPNPYL
jgi:Protein kinase domain